MQPTAGPGGLPPQFHQPPPQAPPPQPAPQRSRRARTSAPFALLFAMAITVVGAFGVITAADRVTNSAGRLDEFSDPERIDLLGEVLTPVDGPAVNYLIIGSDTREGLDLADDTGTVGTESDVSGRRSDTIMILRQEEDGEGAALLSLNRDILVTIADTGAQDRINSAYNRGADVLAATITANYDIPINHVVDVDFEGFTTLVDEIGGVELEFLYATRDTSSGLDQQPGLNRLDGQQALAYVRSRNYQEFRDGQWRTDGTADIGRVQRQQRFISATVNQTLARLQADPFIASELIEATSESLLLDPTLEPLEVAGTLRKAFESGLTTYSLSVFGDTVDGKSILRVNQDESAPIIAYFAGEGPLPSTAEPEG
ncbi:MAG: LCP family protein [Actinomycetota bacterium]